MVDKISRARKKELEQPDPFMESMQSGIDFCVKHKKQVTWIVSLILIVVIVLFGTIYSIKSSEDKASTLLAETLNVYNNKGPAKGYDAVKGSFSKILEKYSNTDAGRLARVDFAAISYKAADFNKAHSLYLEALDDFKDDSAVRNLLLASLGHTCQAEKKYDEADKYFKEITNGSSPLLKAEALFNIGMINVTNGHEKESIKMFKEIVSEHSDSLYEPLAENRIAGN